MTHKLRRKVLLMMMAAAAALMLLGAPAAPTYAACQSAPAPICGD